MADQKTTQLGTLAANLVVAGDWFGVVDVSDTSMAASGTNKKVNLVQPSTWSPVITCSGTNFSSITYTAQNGRYTQLGNIVFFSFQISVNAFTLGSGSGDLQVSLPIAVANSSTADFTRCAATLSGVDLPGTPVTVVFAPTQNASIGTFRTTQDNASTQIVPIDGLSSGDVLSASGFYFI